MGEGGILTWLNMGGRHLFATGELQVRL
jgi:hypothetical protein